jgi:outer membrane protein assembly factor BamA
LRGFEYRGISPRQGPSDEPIGSDWAIVGNAEIAVPLGSETFSWLFFHDLGFIDDGGPRASIGTGIQILIPQFFGPVPMRFELAAPYMKDDLDDTQAFSFSMGALF